MGFHSLMWTLLENYCSQSFSYLFGIFFSFGFIGIWVGLVIGTTLANILNYLFVNYTLNHLKLEQNDVIL